jgi:hypothetical protein
LVSVEEKSNYHLFLAEWGTPEAFNEEKIYFDSPMGEGFLRKIWRKFENGVNS